MRRLQSVFGTVLVALLLIAAGPRPGLAQGTVQGRVTDQDGKPLSGAQVTVKGTQLGALTNDAGRYSISGVPAGTYTVQAELIGHGTKTARVRVGEGLTATQDFVLSTQAVRAQEIRVIGSRAYHTAAEELPVPVDVYTTEAIQSTGTTETSMILQQLSPSVNFPHQTVADGTDASRPFTLRGLSPDHTLVLINGHRRHPTALVHRLGSGIQEGSSGVDMNAIPSNSISRMEVLRDGAAAQYGSDAIAGVVNLVLKSGVRPPEFTYRVGGYVTNGFKNDGLTNDVLGSYGLPIAGGSLDIFGEYRYSNPTNRAGADPRDQITAGDGDQVVDGKVVQQNNPVPQPNHHWGDGKAEDALIWWNGAVPLGGKTQQRGGTEFYTYGGYSHRNATGNGFYRRAMDSRNWPQIYPMGFLPEFSDPVEDLQVSGGFRGVVDGWNWDFDANYGRNRFDFNIVNSLNVSLGPNIPPNQTSFFAGSELLNQYTASLDVSKAFEAGLAGGPLNVAWGGAVRRENYQVIPGEPNSYILGPSPNQFGGAAAPGSQVFPGFEPASAADASRTNVGGYVDVELPFSQQFLADVAGRYEHYSDFGSTVSGKLAMRYQPSRRVTLRAAISNGFRAPNLAQEYFSKISTIFQTDPNTGLTVPYEVGLFRVGSDVAKALGAKPLKNERSLNLSGGMAVSPVDNLTLTADAFFIKIWDRIILSGNLSGPVIEALVAPYGAQQAAFFSNAIDTKTYGVDVTANYRVLLDNGGTLQLTGSFNWTQNRLVGTVRNPPELAGLQDEIFGFSARTALESEHPATITKARMQYSQGKFDTSLGMTYYGSLLVADTDPTQVQKLSPKALWDASVGFQFLPQIKLTVGGRNLFDTYPDLTIPVNSFNGIFRYPRSSPFGFNGRFVYAETQITL
ncbi:MAG: TonB-dependent receptor [Candidatus Palauibacterales bacterium]|nr:TonB-dependent receptor [Candidatus Palauibacterales bacterium]MDP2582844.1 TonB-dependent receptor [Candidatus Palauibacterales bacterium]